MRIGLYSPFLADNIGGGERYLLTVAECLLPQHQVDLIIQQANNFSLTKLAALKQHFIAAFNLNLKNLNVISGPFGQGANRSDRDQFTRQYDIFYYMTDGSFFRSYARRNVVNFMIPFSKPPPILQKFKLRYWPTKTAISLFTKQALERIWKINIDHVQWGVADPQDFKPLPKKKLILNVGRFFSPHGNKHCKRQDFLVKTFKTMCDQGLKGWRLILSGPIDSGADNYRFAKKVTRLAKGYPIIIRHSSSFDQLQKDYGQAKIYWHATGFGIDQETNPQAVEHFGISTIEAMSAAAVPIVINKGGQPEIVTHGINGLLWDSQSELISQTLEVINSSKQLKKLSLKAKSRAKDFSKTRFCQKTKTIFKL